MIRILLSHRKLSQEIGDLDFRLVVQERVRLPDLM